MKNLLLLTGMLMLFISCDQKRYTQQSPEIDTYKKAIADYENMDWKSLATHYADTAKIYNNATKDEGKSLSELIETNKKDATMFSSWDYVDTDSQYEMITTDKGETWVNFWGLWKGVLKANGKTYEIPSHITAQFIDGKIVKEYGYWDNSDFVKNDYNVEVIDSLYSYFSTGEIPKVLELMDANIVWNEAEGNAYADGNPYVGPEAVLNGVFARVGAEHEYFNAQDIELHNMLGNKVLATLRYDAKYKNGGAYNAQVAHLWTLKDGKITNFQQFTDTKKLEEASPK